MKYLFLMYIALSLFSCNGIDKDNLKKTDELNAFFLATNEKFNTIDSATLFAAHKQIQEDLHKIHSLTDSIDEKTVQLIFQMYPNQTQIDFAASNYNLIFTEIKKSEQQLASLQNDVKNNAVTNENLIKYIEIEYQILEQLNSLIDSSYMGLSGMIENMKNQTQKKDSLIQYLEKQNSSTFVN
ncbi:MAG: hypothetical protein IT232_02340 [Flavobacteriales bacterium]|nr:hypothetical protein [Flavobacteriales bacterium]